MPTPNRTIMQKADMSVANLISDGGYLAPEKLRTFMVKLIKNSIVLKSIDAGPIASHTYQIPKVGLNGRVLRPGTSGVALAAADRAKPVTSEAELTTKLMKGEIALNYETLEDSVEQGRFQTTVMNMMSQQVALDMDEICVNGDTTSTDPFLALQDGMLKKATSHVVNAGTVPMTKTNLKDSLKILPQPCNRYKADYEFWTSEKAIIDFTDYVSERSGALGDDAFQKEISLYYQGRPIKGIPVFPDNLGAGTNCTNALQLYPNVAKWGIWRKVRLETEKSAREGAYYIVVSVRAGFEYVEEDAVTKITNIATS